MENNPAPSTGVVTSEILSDNSSVDKTGNLIYAGIIRRGIAFILDYLLILAPFIGLMLIAVNNLALRSLILDYNDEFRSLFGVIFLSYKIYCEYKGINTVGKRLMKIQVVDISGNKITLKQSIIRNVMLIVDSMLSLIVIFIVIFDKNKQRLGDRIAKTVVIRR